MTVSPSGIRLIRTPRKLPTNGATAIAIRDSRLRRSVIPHRNLAISVSLAAPVMIPKRAQSKYKRLHGTADFTPFFALC
jgi:hypothetical protein